MPPSQEDPGSDRALVARAACGDAAAHRKLYDRWRPAVARLARSFAALGADEASDVVQESFVRAFANLGRLRDGARFGPWILAVTRNRALTRIARRRAANEAMAALVHEVEVEDPDRSPLGGRQAEIEVVRRVIDELPEGPERETVRLFYLEGELSAREIAERLGVGKSAVTMRLERFRAKVKRRILAEVARLRGEES